MTRISTEKKQMFDTTDKLLKRGIVASERMKLVYIALYYDWEAQSRQAIEEMAELTKAINKRWRYNNGFSPTITTEKQLRENIIEEIADVYLTLNYMLYLLSFEDNLTYEIFDQTKTRKLDREIQRIKEREAKE